MINTVTFNHFEEEISWDNFLEQALLPPRPLIRNFPLETVRISVNDHAMPVTLNFAGDAMTSWMASLRNHYGLYARAEINLAPLPGWTRLFYQAASGLTELMLCAGGLAGGIFLNNWLVPTNLYSSTFDIDTILEAQKELQAEYPHHPIIIRSLISSLHGDLLKQLVEAGFVLLPTRRVCLLSGLKEDDLNLENHESSESTWVDAHGFSAEDIVRAKALCRHQCLRLNPGYTEHFFHAAMRSGWLKLYGLRYAEGPLSGVIGMIRRNHVLTMPVLGYDLNEPKEKNLYRRLVLRALHLTENAKGILHSEADLELSKHSRNVQTEIEYAAIGIRHLSGLYSLPLSLLRQMVDTLAIPYREKK